MKKYKKIYIEITNNCNLNCSFCTPVTRPKRFMSKEEFESILKKIKDYTDYIYLHIKGEPLLHPKIIEFLKLCETYSLKVNLTTNGTLFPKYAKELSTCKALNKINFSLHSENNIPNYCGKIFESVNEIPERVTIIYRLWTLKDNKLDKKSTETVEKIKDYYNLSREVVEKIKNEKNIKINPHIYVDKDNEFTWPSVSKEKSVGYCYGLKTHIGILVDGTVVPCCLDSEGEVYLGNIYKESLDTIINSNNYKNIKKSFENRNPLPELCQKCTFKNKFTK